VAPPWLKIRWKILPVTALHFKQWFLTGGYRVEHGLVARVRDWPHAPSTCRQVAQSHNNQIVETQMNDETFNLSIRKFLKTVGVNSQREIEQAVNSALAAGAIKGTETFPAKVTLEVAGLKIDVKFEGDIALE